MDANKLAAPRALPALLLAGDELFESEEADALEILDHAHAVSRAIALVYVPNAIAGVFSAFKAEAPCTQVGLGAGPYLARGTRFGHHGAVAIAARADILRPHIGVTKSAVHPTGCDDHHRGSIQAFYAGFNREN